MPAVRCSNKEQMLRARIEQDVSKRQRIEAIIDEIKGLENEFALQKQRIGKYGHTMEQVQ